MIEYLRIRPSGLVVGRFNSDRFQAAKKAKESTKDREQFCDEDIPTDHNVLTLLRCVIDRIEPGVTMGDIFRMVKSYPILEGFIGQYSWCWGIEAIHREADQPLLKVYQPPADDEEEDEEPMVALVLEQYGTIYEKGHLELGLDLCGRSEETDGVCTKFGVSMTPANELAPLPIELSEDLLVFKRPELGGPFLTCRRGVTLLEFLDAIYWEISFYGSPEERTEMRDEIRQTVAEIKSGLAKVETADSFEEMVEKMNQDE